jgi:hypothetical protein
VSFGEPKDQSRAACFGLSLNQFQLRGRFPMATVKINTIKVPRIAIEAARAPLDHSDPQKYWHGEGHNLRQGR